MANLVEGLFVFAFVAPPAVVAVCALLLLVTKSSARETAPLSAPAGAHR